MVTPARVSATVPSGFPFPYTIPKAKLLEGKGVGCTVRPGANWSGPPPATIVLGKGPFGKPVTSVTVNEACRARVGDAGSRRSRRRPVMTLVPSGENVGVLGGSAAASNGLKRSAR